jgi:integrase/recombinase XerC
MALTTTTSFELATLQTKEQADLLSEFVLNRYPNEGTQKAIVTDLKQFNGWLENTYGIDLFKIESSHLGIYSKHLQKAGYKIGSINRKLSSLKAFYRYLHEVNFFPSNKAEYLRLIKNVSKIGSTEAFDKTELKKLFDSFDTTNDWELRNLLICAMQFYFAARVSAILNITFDDILHEASGLKIRLREKGGKIRYLHCNSQILAPTLLEYINRVTFDSGYLFRGYQKGLGWSDKQFNRQNCYSMIKKQTKQLKFKKNLSNHSFRAGFCTAWLGQGYSIDSLCKITGHANLETAKRYDRNSQEASISEMEKMKI